MSNIYNFFAFDLGATSGRSIIATLDDEGLKLKENTRFPNKIIRVFDRYYWDIYALYQSLLEGLIAAKDIKLDSIGIDTWGVDFAYIGKDGSILSQPRSYRDPYTNGMPESYFEKVSRKEVYDLTGIQIMNFNSLFQLYASEKEQSAAFQSAENLLFMPDALSYMLTGKAVCEYTIASTSQLLNPRTKAFEPKLFEAMGLSEKLMHPLVMPGTVIGNVLEPIAKECNIASVPVVAVAGHDTASAVAAVPAENERFAYLSSGTWSLMGIEVESPIINEETFQMNYTNEGGVDGTTRFLKNITGMWLLEQCRKEWTLNDKEYTYPEIVAMSESVENFKQLIDPDDPTFANPDSMLEAIAAYCVRTNQAPPATDAEYVRCIFDSLALKYKSVLNALQKVAPFKIDCLHVIGGGSKNQLLNQATANSIGIPVIAGPSEATAIGNVMLQAKGLGIVNSLQEIRAIIRKSVTPETYLPQDTARWEKAYQKFKEILKH